MALTNESFRDPRKLYRCRVKSPFYVGVGQPIPKVGDIVALPRSTAAEVVHSNKAEWVDDTRDETKSPIKRADPPPAPEESHTTTPAKAAGKKE